MAETISRPKLGFDMAEGLLVRWVKQVGENINKGDILAESKPTKPPSKLNRTRAVIVLQLIVEQGTMVPVNAPIAVIGAAGEKADSPVADSGKPKAEVKAEAAPAAPTHPASAPVQPASSQLESGSAKASPLAKKIAKENIVNLASLQGSGPGGRVVRKDVESAIASGVPSEVSRSSSSARLRRRLERR